MNEKLILKISLAVILIGLIFLFFYADGLDLKIVETLDSIPVEETVKIKGIINKITVNDKVTFLTVQGEKVVNTEVIFFPEKEVPLQEGDLVEINGIVEEYEGKKEIIADEIIIR